MEARLRAPAVVKQSLRVHRASSLRFPDRRMPLRNGFAGTPRFARMAHRPRTRYFPDRPLLHHDDEPVAAGPGGIRYEHAVFQLFPEPGGQGRAAERRERLARGARSRTRRTAVSYLSAQ